MQVRCHDGQPGKCHDRDALLGPFICGLAYKYLN
jgi:hypothetical protein